MPKQQNRIWIELERDTENAELNKNRAALANNMLARLGAVPVHALVNTFTYDTTARRYCFGGDYGYRDLADNGEWFNLDYLGRPN